jgi:uncharacterized damage-inducible protein DinB
MPITDALLPEFDHEMGTTRRLLERVPEDRFPWMPHARSMSLGRLASHLAEIPGWVNGLLNERSFNIRTGEYQPVSYASRAEILAAFDRNVAAARINLASKSDGELLAAWTLQRDGHDLFTVPKVGVVRSFLLNHMIHHRGQLSVYLRLNDVAVPAMYGPSADEG